MALKQPNWTRILTILLVALATLALLYITFSVLLRFTQALLLFVVGAILAYILTPVVNALEGVLRFRWIGIVITYLLIAILLFALGVLLFTPFVQQSKSLADNLQNPSASSLRIVVQVTHDARKLNSTMRTLHSAGERSSSFSATQVAQGDHWIRRVQEDILVVQNGAVSGPSHGDRAIAGVTAGRLPPNPRPRTGVPRSYLRTIQAHLDKLGQDYTAATQDKSSLNVASLSAAQAQAKKTYAAAQAMNRTMATTPILLLRMQTWLDEHHLGIDLHDKFGQAAGQASSQGTTVLNNVVTIVSETANALLNLTLVLIIAFYFLNDGRRLIHQGTVLVPAQYREHANFFLASLDRVLGGYIRGQLFLSTLAGVLGGGGAALLGVPYPLLIGIVTFFLESIPVIGPMVAVVPAVLLSLFFMPLLTTLLLLIWFIIFQQLVTNVLGPRIMGMAVGIHPLEALLAVLVGFPLGGLLGAFLAVPVAGIIHIMLREAYLYWAPKSTPLQAPAPGPAPTPVTTAARSISPSPQKDLPAR